MDCSPVARIPSFRGSTRLLSRQDHNDPRPPAFLVVDLKPARVLPDDLIDEVQSHPGARDGAAVAGAVVGFADPI
jgi:hypothetical protein